MVVMVCNTITFIVYMSGGTIVPLTCISIIYCSTVIGYVPSYIEVLSIHTSCYTEIHFISVYRQCNL